jgi:hypothetical protein
MSENASAGRRQPRRGDELRGLADRVVGRLAAAIPKALHSARIRGRAYCLVLSYGESYFPPTLIVGLEAERRAAAAARGREARGYLYAPAEPAVLLEDPAGARDYALLDEGIARDNAWELGRETLQRVARELTLRDWSGILDVTDDFVALARDYESDDRAESLAASVPADRLALLRSRGWV